MFQCALIIFILKNFNVDFKAYKLNNLITKHMFISGYYGYYVNYDSFIDILKDNDLTDETFLNLIKYYHYYFTIKDDNGILPLLHVNNINSYKLNLYVNLIFNKVEKNAITDNLMIFLEHCNYDNLNRILNRCKDNLVSIEEICEKIYNNVHIDQMQKLTLVKILL